MGKMEKTGKLERMTTGLKKAKIGGAIILAGLGIGKGLNAQDPYVANSWIPPTDIYNPEHGEGRGNFYASGDVNGDDTITWADATMMQNYINGSYTPNSQDTRFRDRSDLNYDQQVNSTDLQMLENHLNTNPFFYPDWYYAKQDRTGQENIILNVMRIDDTENTCEGYSSEDCDCTNYRIQFYTNVTGFPEEDLNWLKENSDFEFDYENNRKFNLPSLMMVTQEYDSKGGTYVGGHGMNTFVLGNNPSEWGDLWNIEPQKIYPDLEDNVDIQPGEGYLMALGDYASVYMVGAPKDPRGETIASNQMRYEINGLTPSFVEFLNTDYINLLTQKDTQNPQISTSLQEGESYGAGSTQTITITDQYPKRQWYSTDGGETKNPLSEGTNNITLPSSEGTFEYIIYAGDEFYNEVLERRNVTIKSTGVGLEDKLQDKKTKIYPNPVTNIATLESEEGKDLYVRKYDLSGKMIGEIFDNDKDGKTEIDFSGLPPSMYIIRVVNSEGKIVGTEKIIKQ